MFVETSSTNRFGSSRSFATADRHHRAPAVRLADLDDAHLEPVQLRARRAVGIALELRGDVERRAGIDQSEGTVGVAAEELGRRRPDLLEVLKQPFFHHYQGSQDPVQPPYYACPIIGSEQGYFTMRVNRKNIVAAERDFPELPRVTPQQWEAIDLLEEIMADDRWCYRMQLEQGDLQLVNNYVIVHSRTPFEDFEEPDRKRHVEAAVAAEVHGAGSMGGLRASGGSQNVRVGRGAQALGESAGFCCQVPANPAWTG